MTPKEFINKAKYDNLGQKILGVDKDGRHQMIADLRGWGGAIQNLFKDKKGEIDLDAAAKFQDELGKYVTDAINEKINSNGIVVTQMLATSKMCNCKLKDTATAGFMCHGNCRW